MAAEEISITLQNSTTADIQVSILGNPTDLADNCNATTEFRYNITSLTFTNETQVSVLYRPSNGTLSYTTYTATLLKQTIQGVVDALNTLGIGSWYTFTSGGNTYLSNTIDSYEFSTINIFGNTLPPTSVLVNWANYAIDGSAGGNPTGQLLISIGLSNIVTSTNGLNESGFFYANNGQVVDVAASEGVADTPPILITSTPLSGTPITTIYSNVVPDLTTITTNFTLATGNIYYITFGNIP